MRYNLISKDCKNLCQCTKCGQLSKTPKKITRTMYNITITENVCPFCEDKVRLVNLPKWTDKYLYINNDVNWY